MVAMAAVTVTGHPVEESTSPLPCTWGRFLTSPRLLRDRQCATHMPDKCRSCDPFLILFVRQPAGKSELVHVCG